MRLLFITKIKNHLQGNETVMTEVNEWVEGKKRFFPRGVQTF
jgi:hypothetical protein